MDNITIHQDDLPKGLNFSKSIAIDTETMGLNLNRDRLCLVQLSVGDGFCHIVQFKNRHYDAPNLRKLLSDDSILKIFQYARFDVAAIHKFLEVDCKNIYCTKIASRLARTNIQSHSLKSLCYDLLGIELEKESQCSDWGADNLSPEQLRYAANDVLFLHRLKDKLDELLAREGRTELAKACFDFILSRAKLDVAGFPEDIFAH